MRKNRKNIVEKNKFDIIINCIGENTEKKKNALN